MIRRLSIAAAAGAALLALLFGLLMGGATFDDGSTSGGGLCGGPPSLSLGTGAIAWPMPAGAYSLSSGYGPRWGAFHAGLDLAAPLGTPYYAAADGVVADAGPASEFGWWVVIDHVIDGQTVSTVYGHSNIAHIYVAKGQQVAAGQHIADVGSEGGSTGPHLHFEVWPGGRLSGGHSVDPAGWLSSNVREGETTVDPVVAAPAPAGGAVNLSGPVPPQGRQATMPLSAEQQALIDTIVGTVKGVVVDDPATPQNEQLRVAVITVAAAMQESSLRVIDYGDTAGPDSRGLYQQRAPWGPYEARMDPVQSTRMFLQGGQGGQRGLLAFDWQHLSLERAVVSAQVSVGGYAKWEGQAMQLVAASAGVSAITGPGGAVLPCAV